MRNVAIILAALLAVSVYGCGKKEEASAPATQPAQVAAPATEAAPAPATEGQPAAAAEQAPAAAPAGETKSQ